MTTAEKLKIYSEVLETSYKVFNFYRTFMILYGNELADKIDKNLCILFRLKNAFNYTGVMNLRKISDNSSWEGVWVGFINSGGNEYNAIYIREEIYEKIAWLIELNKDEELNHLSISMTQLFDFINELADNKRNFNKLKK